MLFDIGSVYYKTSINQTNCIISIGKFENNLVNGTNNATVNELLININNNIAYDICLSFINTLKDFINLHVSSQFNINNFTASQTFEEIVVDPVKYLNLSSSYTINIVIHTVYMVLYSRHLCFKMQFENNWNIIYNIKYNNFNNTFNEY